jgi:quinol-cytochrome oxidoreductase complex cytochrome b subunit
MPAAPALNEQELSPVPTGPRPKSVENAFLLWLIIIGLAVISIIITLTVGSDNFMDAARDALKGQNKTEQEIKDYANAAKVFTAVIAVVFIALYLLFAYKMRAGRNWARITLTVLGGLNVVSILFSLRNAGGVGVVIALIQAIVILAAIYFMYRPEANQYYQASRARR